VVELVVSVEELELDSEWELPLSVVWELPLVVVELVVVLLLLALVHSELFHDVAPYPWEISTGQQQPASMLFALQVAICALVSAFTFAAHASSQGFASWLFKH